MRLRPYFEPVEQFDELRDRRLFFSPSREPARTTLTPKLEECTQYDVEGFFYHQGCVILELVGIDDMASAERLVGSDVWVRNEDLWPLGEGEFLAYELEGAAVVDTQGNSLGTVVCVDPGPGHDFLRVKAGQKEFFVPMVRQFVVKVDLSSAAVTVDLPPGLTDL